MFASSYMTALVSLVLCCGPVQSEVSVKVVPERSQYFERETFSLSCEEDGKPVSSWSVRKNTSRDVNEACNDEREKTESCTITSAYASEDTGVYWCQSGSGEVSRSINITISDGRVILQSPVLPVPEGGNATFHCLYKDQTPGKPSSNPRGPADFYRNGSLFRSESTGQMTILHVSQSDEGFYMCNISGLEPSPESSMAVGEKPSNPSINTDNNNQPDPPSPSVPSYVSALVVSGVCVLILLLILALFLFLWRKYRGHKPDTRSDDLTYADVRINPSTQPRMNTDQSSAGEDIYSKVNLNTGPGAANQSGDVTYSTVTVKQPVRQQQRDQPPADQAIYSTVKTSEPGPSQSGEVTYAAVTVKPPGKRKKKRDPPADQAIYSMVKRHPDAGV